MSTFRTKPNPDQPDRCPSIDPDDTLQCGRKIHDDDQCQFGGIGWKKGTPRYVSAEEHLASLRASIKALADEWEPSAFDATTEGKQMRRAIVRRLRALLGDGATS